MAIDFNFKGSEKIRDGKKYLHVDDAQWIINPKKLTLHFENLFDGAPRLGQLFSSKRIAYLHDISRKSSLFTLILFRLGIYLTTFPE